MESGKLNQCPHCGGGFGLKYTLYNGDNFWIVCDTHPLIEGHILLIPKDHISCMGTLSNELFSEFENMYQKVLNFLNETYGVSAVFEHGVVGQTVFHAHTHFLPFNKSIKDVVNETNVLKPIKKSEEIKDAFNREGKYLFIAINDKKWLVDTKIVTPRFFRDRIAKAVNVPERGNWKMAEDNPKLMLEFKQDIQRLKDKWDNYFS